MLDVRIILIRLTVQFRYSVFRINKVSLQSNSMGITWDLLTDLSFSLCQKPIRRTISLLLKFTTRPDQLSLVRDTLLLGSNLTKLKSVCQWPMSLPNISMLELWLLSKTPQLLDVPVSSRSDKNPDRFWESMETVFTKEPLPTTKELGSISKLITFPLPNSLSKLELSTNHTQSPLEPKLSQLLWKKKLTLIPPGKNLSKAELNQISNTTYQKLTTILELKESSWMTLSLLSLLTNITHSMPEVAETYWWSTHNNSMSKTHNLLTHLLLLMPTPSTSLEPLSLLKLGNSISCKLVLLNWSKDRFNSDKTMFSETSLIFSEIWNSKSSSISPFSQEIIPGWLLNLTS